ncbi:60s ribosomal protein l34-b [Piromyces finnis]|uniref:60s ribosomal protein l34-b n=1 Tax=Piromyces finnis TaxID=1754191 RepID=A0A1Y1VD34_9FUNG|nr:60s ribosomal protein l34-b [Piromyces finnis]|eukprot:ORX52990.1 60s ribosomal protein l34-b [Piromyces finnis]
MVQRVTFRRRLSYNTKSNNNRVVKTPGNRLVFHHISKNAKVPRCAESGVPLSGIKALRPRKYQSISKTKKHVNRAYGGNLSASCVRSRIIRAFLIEEQKIVKKVLKAQTSTKSKKN